MKVAGIFLKPILSDDFKWIHRNPAIFLCIFILQPGFLLVKSVRFTMQNIIDALKPHHQLYNKDIMS